MKTALLGALLTTGMWCVPADAASIITPQEIELVCGNDGSSFGIKCRTELALNPNILIISRTLANVEVQRLIEQFAKEKLKLPASFNN